MRKCIVAKRLVLLANQHAFHVDAQGAGLRRWVLVSRAVRHKVPYELTWPLWQSQADSTAAHFAHSFVQETSTPGRNTSDVERFTSWDEVTPEK